jgi:hypothetical protein
MQRRASTQVGELDSGKAERDEPPPSTARTKGRSSIRACDGKREVSTICLCTYKLTKKIKYKWDIQYNPRFHTIQGEKRTTYNELNAGLLGYTHMQLELRDREPHHKHGRNVTTAATASSTKTVSTVSEPSSNALSQSAAETSHSALQDAQTAHYPTH